MEDDYLFDDGEHFFGPAESTPGFMNHEEVEALTDTFRQPGMLLAVDPIRLSNKLYEKKILTKRLVNEIMIMKANGRSDSVILNYLFSLVPANVNLKSLARLLYECGYKRISEQLFYNYLRKRCPHSKATSGNSEPRMGLRKVSRRLKVEVHNAPFENRVQYLREKENKFESWLTKAINEHTRRSMADIVLTIIGAEVDAIAITFNTELYRNDIFKRYEAYIAESSNLVLSRIGLLGRWANACAIAGKHVEAEEKLREARCLAIFVGPSLEQFNTFYTEVYRRLWEYEQYPSESLKKSILFWGKVGLKCIEDETDPYTISAWKKNNMIRMSLCLLGLGNTTRLIDGCIIDEEDIEEAGLFIQELSRPEIMNSIEPRRLMLFFIIKARWLELNECLENSLLYYNYARCNAETGKSAELNYILEHINRVSNKINANACIELSNCQGNNLIISSSGRNTAINIYNQHVVRLKEMSLDDRDVPSGCSRPDDPVNKLGVNVRNVEALSSPCVREEEGEVTISTELKHIHSENVMLYSLNLNGNNDNNDRQSSSCEPFALPFEPVHNFLKCDVIEHTGLINSGDTLFEKAKQTVDIDRSAGKDPLNSSFEPYALPFEPVHNVPNYNSTEHIGLINLGDSIFGSSDVRKKSVVKQTVNVDQSAGKDHLNSSCEPYALSFAPENNFPKYTGLINSGDSLFVSSDNRKKINVENAVDSDRSAGKDRLSSSFEPFAMPFEPAKNFSKYNGTERTRFFRSNDSIFSSDSIRQKPKVDIAVDKDQPAGNDPFNSSCEPFALTCNPYNNFTKYDVTGRNEKKYQNPKIGNSAIYRLNSYGELFALPLEPVNNLPNCYTTDYSGLIHSGDSLFGSSDIRQKPEVLNTADNDQSAGGDFLKISCQPFAMTCEPNAIVRDDFNSGDLLFCSSDISQTGVKQLDSSFNQEPALPMLENSNNEVGDKDQVEIGICGNRIPSWDREPPSGQSFE